MRRARGADPGPRMRGSYTPPTRNDMRALDRNGKRPTAVRFCLHDTTGGPGSCASGAEQCAHAGLLNKADERLQTRLTEALHDSAHVLNAVDARLPTCLPPAHGSPRHLRLARQCVPRRSDGARCPQSPSAPTMRA